MAEARLQVLLSKAGVASRRGAEKLIAEGRVTVNGEIVTEMGRRADPDKDVVLVDGEVLGPAQEPVTIALHKPVEVVTTLDDPEGRETVADLVADEPFRFVPVGRLDYYTEGVLLLSTDGALTNRLLHPKYHVPKVYLVKVRGQLDKVALDKLRDGVTLEDGPTKPAVVEVVEASSRHTWLEIVVTEGRNRLVRRMCDAVGHTALRVVRTEMGTIRLEGLRPGQYRYLTPAEVRGLYQVTRLRPVPKATERAEQSGYLAFGKARRGKGALPQRDLPPEELQVHTTRRERQRRREGIEEAEQRRAEGKARRGRDEAPRRDAGPGGRDRREDERRAPARDGRGEGRASGGRRPDQERTGDDRRGPGRPRGRAGERRHDGDRPRDDRRAPSRAHGRADEGHQGRGRGRDHADERRSDGGGPRGEGRPRRGEGFAPRGGRGRAEGGGPREAAKHEPRAARHGDRRGGRYERARPQGDGVSGRPTERGAVRRFGRDSGAEARGDQRSGPRDRGRPGPMGRARPDGESGPSRARGRATERGSALDRRFGDGGPRGRARRRDDEVYEDWEDGATTRRSDKRRSNAPRGWQGGQSKGEAPKAAAGGPKGKGGPKKKGPAKAKVGKRKGKGPKTPK